MLALLIRDSTCVGKTCHLEWVGPLVLCFEEISRIPAATAGVYLVHKFYSRVGCYLPLYAGRSNDLRRRLMQHSHTNCTNPELRSIRLGEMLHFSAAPVLDQPLEVVEASLIQTLRPPFNRQIPAGSFFRVNLPPLFM